jgi:hypothetical protein
MSDREDAAASTENDEEWAFTLADIEAREEAAEAAEAEAEPIEPGTPSLEGIFFFLLGVGFAVFVVSRLLLG